jgi:hypothetical protein
MSEIVTLDTAPTIRTDLATSQGDLMVSLQSFEIVASDSDCEAAIALVRDAKAWSAKVTDFFEPLAKAAHAAHKAITTRRADTIKAVDAEATRVQRLADAYLTEKQRQARINAAEEQAAERKRIEDARLAEASRLEAAGHSDVADAVIAEAAVEVANVAAETVSAKVVTAAIDNVSGSEVWTYEITDPAIIPRQFLVPDEKAIAAYVKANKGRAVIAGVRVFSEVKTRIYK